MTATPTTFLSLKPNYPTPSNKDLYDGAAGSRFVKKESKIPRRNTFFSKSLVFYNDKPDSFFDRRQSRKSVSKSRNDSNLIGQMTDPINTSMISD